MTIAGVALVKNEVDIVETTLRHLFLNGVDRIYILDAVSTDGTLDIYEKVRADGWDLRVSNNPDPIFHQARLSNELVTLAGTEGAEWIIPFDADEFFYATDTSLTIAEALSRTSDNVTRAHVFRQMDWELKWPIPERLEKMVFRWRDGVAISMGNHSVNLGGGSHDILDVREIKYRSFEHFCAKIANGLATMDPELPPDHAIHIRKFLNADTVTMRAAWEEILKEGAVCDPVPSPLKGLL